MHARLYSRSPSWTYGTLYRPLGTRWIDYAGLSVIRQRGIEANSRQSFPRSPAVVQEQEVRTVLRNGLMIMFVQSLLLAHSATATLTVYTTEAAWRAATMNVEVFDTTANNIALSNEIVSVPGGNSQAKPLPPWRHKPTKIPESSKSPQ